MGSRYMKLLKVFAFCAALNFFVPSALADELVQTIQQDLATLGYYDEAVDGELDLKTQLAIGRFEEENDLPVTGEPSLSIATKVAMAAEASAETEAAEPEQPNVDEAVVMARQACLDEKKAEAAAKKEKKKMWGKLGRAGGSLLGRFGGAGAAADVYQAAETVDDVSAISEAMGLDEADVEECLSIGTDDAANITS